MKLTRERLMEVLCYAPEIGAWTWRICKRPGRPAGTQAGRIDSHGYRQITVDGSAYLASRLSFLWMEGVWPEKHVDHINMDRKDDRWINLRHADRRLNGGNRRAYSSNILGVKGVSRRQKNGRYLAQIQNNGKKVYLGDHDTVEEASEAYRKAAEKVFGDYHRVD